MSHEVQFNDDGIPLRPFLRWAGSKRLLLDQIVPHVPKDYGTYLEPFLGGGSLFLRLRPSMSILADALEPLVNVWNAIALDADAVFEMASSWQLNSKVYYEVRAMRPPGEIERAAQFMYLNKGAFNGLWRVNSSGGFNVPWGRPKSQFMGDVENIRRVSELTRASAGVVRHADFAQIIRLAKSGDLLFLDPPYVTTKSAGSFIHYNDRVFAWDDQVRLAESAKLAVARGVKVLATNAFHPAIRDLWGGFAHFELTRQSTMAAGSAKRGRVSESLFVSR